VSARTGTPPFVEVNETAILMRGDHAVSTWWLYYADRLKAGGRITTVAVSIGDLVRVSCETTADADWLAGHLIANGVPKSAVRANRPIPRKIRTASGRPRRMEGGEAT
jgi:hypothetical protein